MAQANGGVLSHLQQDSSIVNICQYTCIQYTYLKGEHMS